MAGRSPRRRMSTVSFRARPVIKSAIRVGKSPNGDGLASRDGRSDRERGRAAHARLDRGESPQGRSALRRPARVRLAAEHRGRRLHVVHALLLRAAGQGRRDHRRALQSRRHGRRLHRERARSQADGLLRDARRAASSTSPMAGHLRSEGDADQRVGRLRRRRAAVLLPSAADRSARRHAHLGRARRHVRRSADDRRRRHHRAGPRVLRSRRASGRWRTKASRRTSRSSTPRRTCIKGHDPQLERAVQEAFALLKTEAGAEGCASGADRSDVASP